MCENAHALITHPFLITLIFIDFTCINEYNYECNREETFFSHVGVLNLREVLYPWAEKL